MSGSILIFALSLSFLLDSPARVSVLLLERLRDNKSSRTLMYKDQLLSVRNIRIIEPV